MSSIADPAQPLLDVRLSPHRSLSRRQARLLLCGVAVLSAGVSLPFVLLGAWPVVGFMGLDVLLLYWAFAANFRAARAYEIVCVSTLELFVAKVDQSGRQREWRLHPWWTRLAQEEDEEFGLRKLELVSRDATVEVAAYLGPDEKQAFARLLAQAMAQARRGPQYS